MCIRSSKKNNKHIDKTNVLLTNINYKEVYLILDQINVLKAIYPVSKTRVLIGLHIITYIVHV